MGLLGISGRKDAKAAKGGNQEKVSSSGSSMKWLLILILLLDLVFLAGWLYIRYGVRRSAQKDVERAERRILTMARDGQLTAALSSRLSTEKAQSISQPVDLVNTVLRKAKLLDKIKVQPSTWGPYRGNSNYEEQKLGLQITYGEGLKLEDLTTIMRVIENTNALVQIHDMDFGNRDLVDPGEPVWWRATRMTVRVFRPSQRRK